MALAFLALALTLLAPLPPTDVAGSYEGAVKLPGHELKVEVDLVSGAGGAMSGDISIPEQGAKDVALEAIAVDGDAVTFRISGIPGAPTFKGKHAADGSIDGDFTQGGATFPFHLAAKGSGAAAAKKALEGFGDEIERARAGVEVPGVAVAIVKDGEVVFSGGFGLRDVEKKLPVDDHTLFAIGSASKAFTTFTLATLVEEGKLDWDKPVHEWMPDLKLVDPVANDRMTPRDLVTHRSGLPRHDLLWYAFPDRAREDLVRRIRFLPPSKDFRTDFQYNNLMLLTSGVLIERITHSSWEDAVRTRVLEPLGMHHTNFSVKESAADADHAEPYMRGEVGQPAKKIPFHDISQVGPAGSINSCVADMVQWVRLHLSDGTLDGKPLTTKSALDELHTPVTPIAPGVDPDGVRQVGYALGWFVDEYRGMRRVHHGGNIDGFSALVSLVPEQNLGMVILTNANANGLPELTVRLALDRLVPPPSSQAPPRDRVKESIERRAKGEKTEKEAEAKKGSARRTGTQPSHDLAEYVADYEDPGYGVLSVTRDGDRLSARIGTLAFSLEHWHFDVWSAQKTDAAEGLEGTKLLFRTNIDGDIDAIECVVEPAVDAVVFKRLPDAKLKDPAYLARFVGEYQLDEMTLKVEIVGDALRLTPTGQSPSELIPRMNDTFGVKSLAGYSVKFTNGDDGRPNALEMRQPNGVFVAKRK